MNNDNYTIGENFSITARAFYVCIAILWATPLLLLDTMPLSAKIAAILLEVIFLPVFLFWATWRRIVSFDITNRNLIINSGFILPIFTKKYRLDNFDTLVINRSKSYNTSCSAGDDNYYWVDDNNASPKLTVIYSLTGPNHKIELIEKCCSSSDLSTLQEMALFESELESILEKFNINILSE